MREELTRLVDALNKKCKDDIIRNMRTADVLMRYKLIIPDYDLTADITLDVMNWDELETDYRRDKFSGIMLEQSSDFKVCRETRQILALLFRDKGIHAKARVQTWKRDLKSMGTYLKKPDLYTLDLDMKVNFLTYHELDLWTFFSGQVDNIQEYIKAHKNVKYDIPVKDVVNPIKWDYDRIKMLSVATFVFPKYSYVAPVQVLRNVYFQVPMYFRGIEKVPDERTPDLKDISSGHVYSQGEITPFYTANKNIDIDIEMSGRISILKLAVEGDLRCFIDVRNKDNVSKDNIEIIRPVDDGVGYTYILDRSFSLSLNEGDKLCFVLTYKSTGNQFIQGRYTLDEGALTISWISQGEEMSVNVIDPNILLQRLVNNMSGQNPSEQEYTGRIEWGEMDYIPQIVAAESIRGFEDAVLHTSYYDFDDWMRTLGYEPYYEGKTKMIYVKYDTLFQRDKVSIELEPREVSNLEIRADDSYAYTSVDVGYKKQNYSSPNGRFEVMGTFNYSTGFVSFQDKVLKIVSPYRADFLGVELLCWERLKETTDTSSDNDVFVVALKYNEEEDKYNTYKDVIIDSGDIKLYNAPFTPEMIVKYNESKIGVSSKRLKFESTDAFRDAVKNGVSLYEDIEITKKLFEPVYLEFKTWFYRRIPVYLDATGVVLVPYKGKVYQGYVRRMIEPYGGRRATDWQLNAVK